MDSLKNLELLSPEAHGMPSNAATVHPEFQFTHIEDVCECLNRQIHEEYYPATTKLPFVPKQVFYIADQRQFMLMSTHGLVAYINEGDSDSSQTEVIDLSALTKNEVRHIAMVTPDRVYTGDIYYELSLITISTRMSTSIGHTGILRSLTYFPSNDRLYICDAKLFTKTGSNIARVPLSVPGDTWTLSVRKDQKALALSDESGNIAVYSLEEEKELTRFKVEKEASPIVLTPSYLVAAIGDELHVWSTQDWQLVSVKKGYTSNYTCISVNTAESLVAAGCKDGSVHVWSLANSFLLPQKFVSYSESIEGIEFMSDNKFFYFSSEQSRLMMITVKDFPLEMQKEQDCIQDMIYIPSSNSLVLSIKGTGVIILDATTFKEKKRLSEGDNVLITYNKEANILFTLFNNTSNEHIYCSAYSADNFRRLHQESYIEPGEKWWANLVVTRHGHEQVLQLYANGTLSIFYARVDIFRDCKLHEHEPTAIVSLHSGECSVSGDISGSLILYNLEKFSVVGQFRKHSAPISALAVSNGDEFLLSGSTNGVIQLSDIKSRTLIWSLSTLKHPIRRLGFTENLDFFYVSTERQRFTIWSSHSRTIVAAKHKGGLFATSGGGKILYLAGSGTLSALENPLFTSRLSAFGDLDSAAPLFKYVSKMLAGTHPDYIEGFDNCLITPYQYTPTHFYAYFNLTHHLRAALSDKSFIVEGFLCESPLTLCIKRSSLLMNDVIESLLAQMDENLGVSYFFRNSLNKINRLGSEHLSELYTKLFAGLNLPNLPDFCDNSVKLPLVIESSHTYNIETREFFDPKKVGLGQAIQFKQFPIKMCYEKGSQASIDFLESLIATPSTDVYRTQFIEVFLGYKWHSVKWVMSGQGFLYFLYLILLVAHIASSLNKLFLVPLTLITTILLIYECFQLIGMGWRYFTDLYNIIDTSRSVTYYIYAYFVYTDGSEDTLIGFLVAVAVVSLIRGITYFSLFDSTRYMIYLITQVMKDALAFVILLAYSIIAVSTIFSAMNSNDDYSFITYLETSYNMSLGNYDTADFSPGERIVILFASILNMIIMLNLLISILGDTFDRVQQGLVEADREAIAELVLEAEKLMFWRRSHRPLTYLTACIRGTAAKKGSKQWEGKVRTMIRYIEQMKKTALQTQASQEELTRSVTRSIEALQASTLEKLERMEESILRNNPQPT